MAADVIFLRAATKAAAAWRVALDLPAAGADGLLVDGLLGAAAAALVVSTCAVSATFFLVGISAFRSVGPAAVVAAGLMDGDEPLLLFPALARAGAAGVGFALAETALACVGREPTADLAAGFAAGLPLALETLGVRAAAVGFAALARLTELG